MPPFLTCKELCWNRSSKPLCWNRSSTGAVLEQILERRCAGTEPAAESPRGDREHPPHSPGCRGTDHDSPPLMPGQERYDLLLRTYHRRCCCPGIGKTEGRGGY